MAAKLSLMSRHRGPLAKNIISFVLAFFDQSLVNGWDFYPKAEERPRLQDCCALISSVQVIFSAFLIRAVLKASRLRCVNDF